MQNLKTTIDQLKSMNEYSMAKSLLKVYEKRASKLQELDFIAMLQNEAKDYQSSIANLKKALGVSANPREMYAIRANLAKMYNHLNDPLRSIAYSNANLIVDPKDLDAKMEIGFSKYLYGEYEEGEKIMTSILSEENLTEEVASRIRYNMASYDMERGEFKKGLRGHVEVGHAIGILPVVEIPMVPKWDGTIEEGRTVLILAEGGIGDEIIGIRFCRILQERGMKPHWITTRPQLVDVFKRNGYSASVNLEGIDTSNAVQTQAFYLPVLLDLDETQLWRGPYLKASEEYLEKWKMILPEGQKVAFKWFGNQEYDQDLHRSLSYEDILGINSSGTKISLQLEGCGEEMFDPSSEIKTIEDTLAIITLCGLVISSCTSVAHMAGSMGIPCIVMPPIACYYVWLGRKDGLSHWYGENLQVVRQTKHKNWLTVIEKVNETLNGRT